MAITAAEVNKLRKMTGAGMMDCKKALSETNGDFEAAIDFLRKKGQKVAAKRADRDATEGVVIAATNSSQDVGTVVYLTCETDFVAKNSDFIDFAKSISDLAVSNLPNSKEELLGLELSGKSLAESLTEQVGKIGEKIEIGAYEKLQSDSVVAYNHAGFKIGVLVGLNQLANDSIVAAGKDAAMQVAALNAMAVDKDGVSQEIVDRELKIGREQAIAEGKPEQIVDKIAP